jgi:hypothetical protein
LESWLDCDTLRRIKISGKLIKWSTAYAARALGKAVVLCFSRFMQRSFIMSIRSIFVACVAVVALAGCATVNTGPAPVSYSPDEIIAMSSKAGNTPATVVQTLKAGRSFYALPASELARMSKAGVSDEVVNYLQASHLEATRLATLQQTRYESPFWYGSPYGMRTCWRAGRGWITCI